MGNCGLRNCISPREPPLSRKLVLKPEPWVYIEPITKAELRRLRREFWARPYRRGRTEIWEALRVAATAELPVAELILESYDIFHQFNDLRVCYDSRGTRYELPLYCLSEPENLIHTERTERTERTDRTDRTTQNRQRLPTIPE